MFFDVFLLSFQFDRFVASSSSIITAVRLKIEQNQLVRVPE